MLLIRVGNVDFHGFTTHGFLISPGGFKGWEGSAATKRDAAERVGRHGAFSAPAFKSARLVSVAGTALADSEAELEHMGEVLAGVGQSEQTITVTTEQGTRWGVGSVEGEIKFDRVGGHLEAAFAFSLYMPDSFKYGETRDLPASSGDSVTFGSTVQMHHRGTVAALPKFTVTATTSMTSGYQIKGKGRTFEVPGPLNVGSTDKVDYETGTVRRDGAIVTGVVPRTFDVNGGESVDWRLWPLSGAGTAVPHLTDKFA